MNLSVDADHTLVTRAGDGTRAMRPASTRLPSVAAHPLDSDAADLCHNVAVPRIALSAFAYLKLARVQGQGGYLSVRHQAALST
jgi:hypothetical protein